MAVTVTIPEWKLTDRLRKAREAAGLRQADLGRELELSRTTIAGYEQGRYAPSYVLLMAWALRCGVPLEWLRYGLTPEPEPDPSPTPIAARKGRRTQVRKTTTWYIDRRNPPGGLAPKVRSAA